MSDSSSEAPQPPLVPGEHVKLTRITGTTQKRKLGERGIVREWRGHEVVVDLDGGSLVRTPPSCFARLEEPADTAVGEKMAFVCARCGELRYRRYDRKIQYECPKCVENKMYHPQLRKARERAGRLTPMERDKKPMVCPECGSVEYKDISSTSGCRCQKCERDMLSPSEREEIGEGESKKKEDSRERKKWVCDKCGSVKRKDPNITSTTCPECGIEMTRWDNRTEAAVCPECGSVEYTGETYRVLYGSKKCEECDRKMLYHRKRKNRLDNPPVKESMKKEKENESKSIKEDNKSEENRISKIKKENEDNKVSVKVVEEVEIESGHVYVLVSSEKPNLVKIGSTRRDPKKRAEELSSSTGVAMPYIVAYQAEADHPEEVEKAVHNRLSERRVNPNREFFRVETRRAIEIIEQEM